MLPIGANITGFDKCRLNLPTDILIGFAMRRGAAG